MPAVNGAQIGLAARFIELPAHFRRRVYQSAPQARRGIVGGVMIAGPNSGDSETSAGKTGHGNGESALFVFPYRGK
ncbi:MAG: hypothetical protein KGL39_25850 [Patescibacteria group bacterium]|nr:hypothetical protein [Patescibacteria group bacterium]